MAVDEMINAIGAGHLALMLWPREAKGLLINLLLAASPHKDGLRDVITGCAHGLEPAFEGAGRICPIEFNISAVILRAIEREDEEPVCWCFGYANNESYILLTSAGETWGYIEDHGGFRWLPYSEPRLLGNRESTEPD